MPYVADESLRNRLSRKPRLPWRRMELGWLDAVPAQRIETLLCEEASAMGIVRLGMRRDTAIRRPRFGPDRAHGFARHRYSVLFLERAGLHAAIGELDAARRVSRRMDGDGPMNVVRRIELGELAERQGGRELVRDSYRFVAAIWNHADPLLQPYVERARAGLAPLSPGPRPGGDSR